MEPEENEKQKSQNAGMIEGEENMTPAEYYKACKRMALEAIGMEEIPPEQWHDEWD